MTITKEILARGVFDIKLNDLLVSIGNGAEKQFQYNLNSNVPSGILTLEESAQHAINQGIVSAINKMFGFDCDQAIKISVDILEGTNCHREAKVLSEFISEN